MVSNKEELIAELEEHLIQVREATPRNPFILPGIDADDVILIAMQCPILDVSYQAAQVAQMFMEKRMDISKPIADIQTLC